MGFVSEFREFALKGNVLDLAVGVIIGAAFGKIVNSIIEDLIMPVVGMAGNVDFTNAYIPLSKAVTTAKEAADKAIVNHAAAHAQKVANGLEAASSVAPSPLGLADARKIGPVLAYGNFITITINFIILAFCIFLVVKLFNSARRRFEAQKAAEAPAAPAGPSSTDKLLMEIRDALKSR
ncbi:MAG: MscL family protein [Phycisphaerales bacterium]|nr:MscL family protein [Phycisphaerales bacterium]